MERLRQFRVRRSGGAAVALTLAATLLFTLLLLLAPSPAPYVAITLETEELSYSVVRPESAAFPVQRARIAGFSCEATTDAQGGFTGLVEPAKDAMVRYRWGQAEISVIINGGKGSVGRISTREGDGCDLPTESVSIVEPTRTDATNTDLVLPIVGPASAGIELRNMTAPQAQRTRTPSISWGGTVVLFGRTSLWPNRNALFPIDGATFPIPAGSRLASGQDIGSRDPALSGSPWYGIATAGTRGFAVAATSESKALVLYKPGPEDQRETFGVGLLARVFNDPSLAYASLTILAFTILGQMMTGWMGIWRDDEERAPGTRAAVDDRSESRRAPPP